MKELHFPVLTTERLILRQFKISDAHVVQKMAGHYDVASNTMNMPYPYLEGMAEQWIEMIDVEFEEGKSIVHAICSRQTGKLIGAIGLTLRRKNRLAELGYWIGTEHWNKGYCSEAAKVVIDYAFNTLHLHKVFANYFHTNPASGRVMQKAGMHYEGTLKSHVWHFDVFKDLIYYGVINPSEVV